MDHAPYDAICDDTIGLDGSIVKDVRVCNLGPGVDFTPSPDDGGRDDGVVKYLRMRANQRIYADRTCPRIHKQTAA